MPDPNRTVLTYRYERWRAVSAGILETAGTTFLLLVAVRWFEAGALAKASVVAGGSLGLMLTPLVVTRVAALGWPVALAASRLAMLGLACFCLMALLPFLPVYVLGSVLAMTASSAAIPLLTQVYQENYPELQRGKLFSHTSMIRIAVAAIFSELAGCALSAHISYFRWLLMVFAAAYALAAISLARVPSHPLSALDGTHPFRALRYARDDRVFRITLIS